MGQADEEVSVVAHGLLNAMTAVIGGIDVALRSGDLGRETASALDAAKRTAQDVNDVLRQLVQGVPADIIDLRFDEANAADQ